MTSLRRLAGRVWLYPHDPDPDKVQPCVAVIADDAGSIVVDAGHSPALARSIQAAIATAGLPTPRQLVYTHHHWDHVWGACAWPDLEIIGHSSGARILEDEARRPWSHAYLDAEIAANPKLIPSFRARRRAMSTWDAFTILPPHTEFDSTITLPSGVEARHVGGGHCVDATVVAIPDSGVLLLGDAIYPPPYHLRHPDDGYDQPLIRRLLSDFPEVSWFVGAHNHPLSRSDLQVLLA